MQINRVNQLSTGSLKLEPGKSILTQLTVINCPCSAMQFMLSPTEVDSPCNSSKIHRRAGIAVVLSPTMPLATSSWEFLDEWRFVEKACFRSFKAIPELEL